MDEIWKDVPGYEGKYQVSNLGNIKSLAKSLKNGKTKEEKILSIKGTCGNGYYKITLSKNGKLKTWLVHKLVAQSFLYKPDYKVEINHKDGNKLNNKIDNLEYCTSSENKLHAFRTGLRVSPNVKGEKNPRCKMNETIVNNIRENKFNLTTKEFSILLNVTTQLIGKIKRNQLWRHI